MSGFGFREGWIAAAAELERPYPIQVFTDLSADEIAAAVKAMNAAVPHASERLHARWARHWAEQLREQVDEPPEEQT